MTLFRPQRSQTGVVAIELAFIIGALFLIFSFSWQLGRYLYWQQHFNYTTERFSKLLVLNTIKTNKLDSASFDDALTLIKNQPKLKDFDIGLRINILSDNRAHEQSFDVGSGCNKKTNYPDKMERLPSINAAKLKTMPPRYLLGISLCAQPKNWSDINS